MDEAARSVDPPLLILTVGFVVSGQIDCDGCLAHDCTGVSSIAAEDVLGGDEDHCGGAAGYCAVGASLLDFEFH